MNKYFAYGSNLNSDDLKRWCAGHSRGYPLGDKVAVGFMPDKQPAFICYSPGREGGVLSYRDDCIGHVVPGAVFEVDDAGLATLDMKEDAREDGSGLYVRKDVVVLTDDDRQIDAVTYQANPLHSKDFVKPKDDYVRVVKEGYQAHRLDEQPLVCASENQSPPFLIKSLFTYGTLMRGECRNHVLLPDKAGYMRMALTKGRLLDLGSYPGMVFDDENSRILGEVCDMLSPSETLCELDAIEGFRGIGSEGSLFKRAIVPVVTAGGSMRRAWVYLYDQAHGKEVSIGGSWRERGVRHYLPINPLNIRMDELVWCIWATTNDLACLKDTIDSGDYQKLCSDTGPWGGADVMITGSPISGTSKTVVVTSCWKELSWLFGMLKQYFDWHLDYLNKYAFYQCLADAATSFISEAEGRRKLRVAGKKPRQRSGPGNDSVRESDKRLPGDRYAKDLLNRVIDTALCILDDLDKHA